MTRTANQLAATMAKATSRRGFLGHIARLAGGAALALAGLAAGTADAAKGGNEPARHKWCCLYAYDQFPDFELVCSEGPCPKTIGWGGRLVAKRKVADCRQCYG